MNIIVRRLQYLIAAIALMISFAQAQTPVQVNPQLLPPYSLQVSDYYSGLVPKLQVLLLNRDINQPTIQVKLRMTIESQNCKLRTKDNAVTPTFTLTSGIPYYLTPQDLQSLFAPANLDFLGGYSEQAYTQTGRLPEGLYTFTIEANELYTGNLVSNKGFSMAWLTLADPPFLNTPSKAEGVTPATPQQIVFTWTPRHQASPTAAYLTTYIFSIVEDNSGGTNPEAAFASNPPLYTDSVLTTTYLYDAAKPQLIPGKNYAWRIQAVAKNGAQNLAMFRNNGISETFWFTYQNNCPVPNGITATVQGLRSTIEWLSNPVYLDYKVEYREKNNPDAQWFTMNNTQSRVMLTDLKPSTQYEYRVGGSCREGAYTFSTLQSFTTTGTAVSMVPNCGDSTTFPAGSGSLQTLVAGDTIKAGSFTVNIGYVTGTGSFTGQGYVRVPWLMNAKVEVRFTNITVSLDRKLKTGIIETTYDPTESGIADIDEYIDIFQAGNAGSVITGDITADTTLNVTISWPGGIAVSPNPPVVGSPVTITITQQGGGAPIIITANHLPTTIKDAAGNVYQVNSDGTVKQIAKAGGKAVLEKANKKLIDNDKGLVTFVEHSQQQYAFDAWKKEYNKSSTFNREYEKIPMVLSTGLQQEGSGGSYFTSAKAIAPGVTDLIKIKVEKPAGSTINPDSIQYINGKGLIFSATPIPNDSGYYQLQVTGGPAKDAQEIYAVYPQSGGKTLNLGKLLVASYPRKEYKVKLVPVNGATINPNDVQTAFNTIYNPLNVFVTVTVDSGYQNTDWDTDGDGFMQMDGTGFLTSYTEEMKILRSKFKISRTVDPGTVYVFVLKKASRPTVWGDLPRGKQFGFLFTENTSTSINLNVVCAHEFSHSVFRSKHIFDDYGFATTDLVDNLLNYNQGTKLVKYQWDLIADPPIGLGLFDSDNDGLYASINTTADLGVFKNPEDNTLSFAAPSGLTITLPSAVQQVTFSTGDSYQCTGFTLAPFGTLVSFQLNDKTYYAAAYLQTGGTNCTNDFSGYEYKAPDGSLSYYIDDLTKNFQRTKAIVGFPIMVDGRLSFKLKQILLASTSAAAAPTYKAAGPMIQYYTYEQIANNSNSNPMRCTTCPVATVFAQLTSYNEQALDYLQKSGAQGLLNENSSVIAYVFPHAEQINKFPEVYDLCFDGFPVTDNEYKDLEPLTQQYRLGNVEIPLKTPWEDVQRQMQQWQSGDLGIYRRYDGYLQKIKTITTITDPNTLVSFLRDTLGAKCKCLFDAFDLDGRKYVLRKLLDGNVMGSWMGLANNKEYIFNLILSATPQSQQADISNWFAENNYEMFATAYSKLDLNALDEFLNRMASFRILTDASRPTQQSFEQQYINVLSSTPSGQAAPIYWMYDGGMIGYTSWEGVPVHTESTTSISNGNTQITIGSYVTFNYGQPNAVDAYKNYSGKPYDWIYVEFRTDFPFATLPGGHPITKGTKAVVPLFWLHWYVMRYNSSIEMKKLRMAFDLIVIASTAGSGATIAGATELAFAGTDLVLTASSSIIEQNFGAEGVAFLDEWNVLYATYGVGAMVTKLATGGWKIFTEKIPQTYKALKDANLSEGFGNSIIRLGNKLQQLGAKLGQMQWQLVYNRLMQEAQSIKFAERFTNLAEGVTAKVRNLGWAIILKSGLEYGIAKSAISNGELLLTELRMLNASEKIVERGVGTMENVRYKDAAGNVKYDNFEVILTDDGMALLVNRIGKARLLPKIESFPNLKSWVSSLDDLIDGSLISKIDKLDNSYLAELESDISSVSNGTSLKQLLRESPEDLNDIWKKLKEDPTYSFELAKTGGTRWDKWAQGNFFKTVTKAGKDFEEFVSNNLSILRTKLLTKYPNLDLNSYAIFEQVQVKTGQIIDGLDEFFVADFVLVKKEVNAITGIENLNFDNCIVLETKLSEGTSLTIPQKSALAKVKILSNTFDIRSVLKQSTTNNSYSLGTSTSYKTLKINDYIKVYSNGTGNTIQDIISLK